MTLQEAEDEFAVRFYYWAREESRKEVEAGFPLLKQIETKICRKFIQWVTRLPRDEQVDYAAMYVRRFNQRALKLLGESIGPEEIAEFERFRNSLALELDSKAQAFWHRQLAKDPTAKVNRSLLRKSLKECLAPIFGQPDKWGGGGTWRYVSSIEALEMATHFDTGGNRQLSYFHRISFSDKGELAVGISFLSWLGVSGGTDWDELENSKIDQTASLVAELCNHFFQVAPKLLKGIAP